MIEQLLNWLGWYRWYAVTGGPGETELKPREWGSEGSANLAASARRAAMGADHSYCEKCGKSPVQYRSIWLRVKP